MDEQSAAAAALESALQADRTFAGSAQRLSRALDDLIPYADRERRLLVIGAELGLPSLLGVGEVTDARRRMVDQAGMRHDVADWVVASWLQALGGPSGHPGGWAALGTAPAMPTAFQDAPVEAPGTPTAIRLGANQDGSLWVGVVTLRGMFVGAPAIRRPGPLSPEWRLAAAPKAPTSRDLALGTASGRAIVTWSDVDGLHHRELSAGADDGGEVLLSEPRLLLRLPADAQPRYPLATMLSGEGTLQTLWTADRVHLHRVAFAGWAATSVIVDLPPFCQPDERITGLDLARETELTAWLVATTDRGRLMVARWDLRLDDISSWVDTACPVSLAGAGVVTLSQGPTLVASTVQGHLLFLDVRRAAGGVGEWHSLDRPDSAPRFSVVHGLAVSANGDRGWLAVAGDGAAWLAPLSWYGDLPLFGTARLLELGERAGD